MDHFLICHHCFPLAISQGGKLPATAHWWFSFYSKPCGSLLRTSAKRKKREGGEGHLGKTDSDYSESCPHPVLGCAADHVWDRVCRVSCTAQDPRAAPGWKILLELVSVQRSQMLQVPAVILGYFLAPDPTGPSLDPDSLRDTKWPRAKQGRLPWDMEPESRRENAKLPKWPDWVSKLLWWCPSVRGMQPGLWQSLGFPFFWCQNIPFYLLQLTRGKGVSVHILSYEKTRGNYGNARNRVISDINNPLLRLF